MTETDRRGTNIRLAEGTHRRAKAAAALAGKSLSEWVELAILAMLEADDAG